METMQEIFAATQAPLFEDGEDALDLILEADDDTILEDFEEEDADRLDFLADLLEAAARAPLSEQQALALEGLGSWLKKKAGAVKKKLAPGTKMVFGKVVKVGKGAVGAAKATGRAAVTAKRGVQAHTFRFTAAGKQARAAAKKVRDTKGRAAGKASYGAAKETYKAASRAGETRGYAAGQAAKAQAGVDKRSKAKQYGPAGAPAKKRAAAPKAASPVKKAPPKKGAPKKAAPKRAPVKGKGGKKKRMESMQDVFNMLETMDNRHGWSEILRACGGNEGIAYVVKGTLDGIADNKKPNDAFFDSVDNENFYGDRSDIVRDRKKAQDILSKTFGVKVVYR